MIEAISVAVHAAALTPVSINDTAVVMGTGMIGLLTLQAARIAGCGKVIAIDVDDTRLATARDLGATHTLNAKTTDVVTEVRTLTDGRGADVALECVGGTPTYPNGHRGRSQRRHSNACGQHHSKNRNALAVRSFASDQAPGLMRSVGRIPRLPGFAGAGAIRVDPMLSAVAPLDEGIAWFERLYNHEPNLMKVVCSPLRGSFIAAKLLKNTLQLVEKALLIFWRRFNRRWQLLARDRCLRDAIWFGGGARLG